MMKMMESSFGQNDRCMYVYIYIYAHFVFGLSVSQLSLGSMRWWSPSIFFMG